MRRILIPFLAMTVLCGRPLVLKGQDSDMTDMTDEDSGDLAPTSAKLQICTNKLGYTTGQQMQVRVSTDPKGDTTEYTMFIFRENIETGERKYADGLVNS